MKNQFWNRGGGWVLIQWALMIATFAVGPVWSDDWSGAVGRVVAMVLLLAGAVFGIAGAVQLGRFRTVFPEPKEGARLVTDGIFGVVRHPLYTSVILLSLAWALWWQSGPSLLFAVATAVLLDAKSRHEEQRLRKHFPDYGDYARRVKRLLPYLY